MKKATQRAAVDVAALATMSLAELRAEWQRRYGPPPRHRAADLLRRVLAWRIQSDVLGGLDAPTRRMLEKEQAEVQAAATPGMRLAREWAGKRHEVVVTENGVVHDGRTYGSLSEVARHITGQRWNGPRFFGLRQENAR
jgi:Protein of unknown function (DUF2924)